MKTWASRHYTVSPSLEVRIQRVLQSRFGITLQHTQQIATAIRTLSNYYIRFPKDATPWKEKWCQIAYLAYYLPLNEMRVRAVFEQGQKVGFFEDIKNILDFGSGLGSGSYSHIKMFDFQHFEKSYEAQGLHQELLGDLFPTDHWHHMPPSEVPANSLGLFSYSLTELSQLPKWASSCDALMIIEPSTGDDGRKLMKLRESLLERGFYAWAPCSHQDHCPLLQQSNSDWCHDRIHFEQPDWFKNIEAKLPMRNRTLTMSYLLLSKRKPSAQPSIARTIGDMLFEKGKTRQLICRGDKREFLTWVHKESGVPEEVPRGLLFNWPTVLESKSNELRIRDQLIPFLNHQPELPDSQKDGHLNLIPAVLRKETIPGAPNIEGQAIQTEQELQ